MEDFDQLLALREEVARLRQLVEDTVRWLRFSGHPVKAALLQKDLNEVPGSATEREKYASRLTSLDSP